MINPKYKNVFMAPDVEHDEPSAKEPLVVNGHTINSKLGSMDSANKGRTIAETLRKQFSNNGQTIGSAMPDTFASDTWDQKPGDPYQPGAEK